MNHLVQKGRCHRPAAVAKRAWSQDEIVRAERNRIRAGRRLVGFVGPAGNEQSGALQLVLHLCPKTGFDTRGVVGVVENLGKRCTHRIGYRWDIEAVRVSRSRTCARGAPAIRSARFADGDPNLVGPVVERKVEVPGAVMLTKLVAGFADLAVL
jgi:hypothetical protein